MRRWKLNLSPGHTVCVLEGWIWSEDSDSGLGDSKDCILEMKKIWTSSSPCENIEIIKRKTVVMASLAFNGWARYCSKYFTYIIQLIHASTLSGDTNFTITISLLQVRKLRHGV